MVTMRQIRPIKAVRATPTMSEHSPLAMGDWGVLLSIKLSFGGLYHITLRLPYACLKGD